MRTKIRVLAVAAILMTAALTGCDSIFGSGSTDSGDDAGPLTVSLTTKKLNGTISTSFYSDEDFRAIATVGGSTGSLTYRWYLNGELLNAATSSIGVYFLASSRSTGTIKVVVGDGTRSAEQSKTVTIKAGCSLRVLNNSAYAITKLYIQPDGSSTFSSSNEILQGSTIAVNSLATVYGFSAGHYDLQFKTSHMSGTRSDVYFALGVPKLWTITTATNSLSTVRTLSGLPPEESDPAELLETEEAPRFGIRETGLQLDAGNFSAILEP